MENKQTPLASSENMINNGYENFMITNDSSISPIMIHNNPVEIGFPSDKKLYFNEFPLKSFYEVPRLNMADVIVDKATKIVESLKEIKGLQTDPKAAEMLNMAICNIQDFIEYRISVKVKVNLDDISNKIVVEFDEDTYKKFKDIAYNKSLSKDQNKNIMASHYIQKRIFELLEDED